MRASIQWLRELTGLELPLEELAEKLTTIGLEVDAVERFEAPDHVVVGEIVAKEKHPDKDRLSIVQVFDGEKEETVICGAPNVPEPGGHVLFARVGASLTLEDGSTLDIAERKIAGVVSRGMICSESELRVGSGGEGIFVFEDEPSAGVAPAAGTPLAKALPVGDVVFEIGLTPNRPDCLGHIGIARDIAAVYGEPFAPPAVAMPARVAAGVEAVVPEVDMREELDWAAGESEAAEVDPAGLGPFAVEIQDAERCPRYGAAFVLGGTVRKSPFWLRYRLHVLGLRSRSNLVDVTNYVMLESGHPLHGFDLETLRGRKIVVRTATEGERMTTLDDVERTLSADDLLICDGEGPVAIAGVMGGEDSEISEKTRHVAIECAYFDPRSVRRTSRRLGMHTDASHRFERGVDPNDVPYVLARTASLMAELGGGVALAEALDAYPEPIVARRIVLRHERLEALLGFSVPREVAVSCLERIGCTVSGDEALEVSAPTWRPDIAIEEDLVEEVVRVYGYEHVPAVVPAIEPSRTGSSFTATFERRVKESAAALGLYEAINHAFVAPSDLADARAPEAAVRLTNPLSEERSVMRTSLLPGLATAAGHALRRQAPGARLFEVGRTIHPRDGGKLPDERDTVGIFLAGSAHGPDGNAWIGGDRAYDFYDLKGFVEALLDAVAGVRPTLVAPERLPGWAHPRRAGEVLLDGQRIGVAAELHPEVGEALGLEENRGQYAELSLEALRAVVADAGASRAPDLPKVPAVVRDMALMVDTEHTAGAVAAALTEGGGELIESVTLFDRYEGEGVPEGKRSLAFRLVYRHRTETLTDKVVDKAHAAAAKAAADRCGAQLR